MVQKIKTSPEELKSPSVSVILPVFNEEKAIGDTLSKVLATCKELDTDYEILLVDDGSTDRTAEIAAGFDIDLIQHPYNIGNGAAVKNGIRHAKNDIIILMDGDGQHDPAYFKEFLMRMPKYDMVVGARTKESKAPWYRNIANLVYNLIASYVSGRKIPDLTSGFRAIKRPVAVQFVHLLPNSFSYPSTITLSISRAGYSFTYIPIKVDERIGTSKINLIKDGLRFLVIILRISVFFAPLKIFLPISVLLVLGGISWYAYQYLSFGKLPLGSVLITLSGLMIFSLALISEQISYLRAKNDGLK